MNFEESRLNAEDIARKLGFVEVRKDRVATCGDKFCLSSDGDSISDNNCYTVVAEDIARKLGFTQTQEKFSPTNGRKIYESIRRRPCEVFAEPKSRPTVERLFYCNLVFVLL